jgi:hypothetical protein
MIRNPDYKAYFLQAVCISHLKIRDSSRTLFFYCSRLETITELTKEKSSMTTYVGGLRSTVWLRDARFRSTDGGVIVG